MAQYFDWAAVMPQYLDLATELAAMRRDARPTTPRLPDAVSPQEIDPFRLYAGYPSGRLSPDDTLEAREALTSDRLTALDAVNGRALYKRRLVPDADLLAVADRIATSGPLTLADLTAGTRLPPATVESVVLFLLKYDIVALAQQEPK